MNIGDVKIQGEKTVLEIDAVFKMKSKINIRKHLESMSEYLLDVVNSIASDFVAANPNVKKLLKEKIDEQITEKKEKPAKLKKEKVEKIKKLKKPKLHLDGGSSKAIKIKIPGAISHIPDIKWKDPFKK